MPVITIPQQDMTRRSEVKSLKWDEAYEAFKNMDPEKACYVRNNAI